VFIVVHVDVEFVTMINKPNYQRTLLGAFEFRQKLVQSVFLRHF